MGYGARPLRGHDPRLLRPGGAGKDLLSNGIFASVAFPTLPGFGGRKFAGFQDKELALACRGTIT
jgi:hypothetical protein